MEYFQFDENIRKIIYLNTLYFESNGENGERADFEEGDLVGLELSGVDLRGAKLFECNLSYSSLANANLRRVDLTDAYLVGANLKNTELVDANLAGAILCGVNVKGAILSDDFLLPTPEELISHLWNHVQSSRFDQVNWCGTSCCISGAAGETIGNQSLGVVVIMQVLPEFRIDDLYQPYPKVAIDELRRVAALYDKCKESA
jgi:uncharacterized protein YjbI with pentapeptide repeats